MQIELDAKRWNQLLLENTGAILLVVVVLLFSVGLLGKTFTPPTNTLLSWSEWQIVKVQKEYSKELSRLMQQAEALSSLLDRDPDPIRAEIITQQIAAETNHGSGALERQRSALQMAAQKIRAWAIGSGSYETAKAALDQAIALIQAGEVVIQQNKPIETGVNEWR